MTHGTYDPDEDLFNFDEVALEFYGSADEEDLEEIFAAFEDEEQAEVFQVAQSAPEERLTEVAPALPSSPVPQTPVSETLAPEPNEPSLDTFRAGAPAPPATQSSSSPRAPLPAPAAAPAPAPAPAATANPIPAPPAALRVQHSPGLNPQLTVPVEPPTAPTQPESPPTPSARSPYGNLATLLKGSPAILIAVTCLNALVAVVALTRSGGGGNEQPAGVQQRPVVSFDPVPERTPDRNVPLLPPTSPERHPTFVLALEEIARGEYLAARRRIYGLLSIVDRLETAEREAIETRAHFLLAEALHLEALQRMERDPSRGGRP